MVAGAEGHPRVEPDHGVAGEQHVGVAFPQRHPVQPAEAPGFEVGLVAVAPVLVGQRTHDGLPGGRRSGGGQQREQVGPAGAGRWLTGKDAHDPGAARNGLLQQGPPGLAELEQHIVHVVHLVGGNFDFDFA